jgi:para-aminobenzoate synthetase component 1
VLELRSANGAFAAIEDHLRAAGFFGGGAEDVVADLYLGYALSSVLRRGRHPDPPERCPLPLAACRVRPEIEPRLTSGAFGIGEWSRTWDEDAYAAGVDAVKGAIERGDVYQVNLVQHL